jgi:hypothetical protein
VRSSDARARIRAALFLRAHSCSRARTAICGLYEKELKALNPQCSNITYDVSDLFTYLDQIADISCLVFNASINAYHPRQKDWVKKQVFNHLRRQASV